MVPPNIPRPPPRPSFPDEAEAAFPDESPSRASADPTEGRISRVLDEIGTKLETIPPRIEHALIKLGHSLDVDTVRRDTRENYLLGELARLEGRVATLEGLAGANVRSSLQDAKALNSRWISIVVSLVTGALLLLIGRALK